ncbi:MAG: acetate/propionate family kinase [Pseudomonadales bacterium]
MSNAILVLNAGSSSIKFSLFAVEEGVPALLLNGQLDGLFSTSRFKAKTAEGSVLREYAWPDNQPLGHEKAIVYLNDFLQEFAAEYKMIAVGHRVVHGGAVYEKPVRITQDILVELEFFCDLAPLHQPHNVKLIRLFSEKFPDLPQVACFDTAFHHTQSTVASAFALPPSITEKGVRRYGFHGLSYEYIASVALPRFAPELTDKKVVVLHLGNGVSLCAMQSGKSVATTMGFSALDGVPMSSRCGSLDPGVILYLLNALRMSADEIEKLLYQQSGLLGVSGESSDMRELLESHSASAQFAVELFVYRIAREIGSLAAALGGLDALVFTAGIGENAAIIREKISKACAWLGVDIDAASNAKHQQCVSTEDSRVSVWVIPTNEELMIAQHAIKTL